MRLEEAFAEALEVEQQALEAYKDLLPRVAGDAALDAFVRNQMELEAKHVHEIVETRRRRTTQTPLQGAP